MSVVWIAGNAYGQVEYESEADLESAILEVQHRLFGANRFYLDIKRKIGTKGSVQNIPDGYLLDLSGSKPRLWVVENELQAHDPLRHIALQILQFSLSFESERLGVKKILVRALQNLPDVKQACESYCAKNGYRNFDHLLEYLVESPFSALVVIDSIPDNLETVLSTKFKFGVEVLELSRFENEAGDRIYQFEPFLEEVIGEVSASSKAAEPTSVVSSDEIDTIVVPSREDGFTKHSLAKIGGMPYEFMVLCGLKLSTSLFIKLRQSQPSLTLHQ